MANKKRNYTVCKIIAYREHFGLFPDILSDIIDISPNNSHQYTLKSKLVLLHFLKAAL